MNLKITYLSLSLFFILLSNFFLQTTTLAQQNNTDITIGFSIQKF